MEITYARNLERNVVALPARLTTRTPEGKVVAAELTLYDGTAHDGLAEGVATAGNETARYQLAVTDRGWPRRYRGRAAGLGSARIRAPRRRMVGTRRQLRAAAP